MQFGVPLLVLCLALGSTEATISLKLVSRLYLPFDKLPVGGGAGGAGGAGGGGGGGGGAGGRGGGGRGRGQTGGMYALNNGVAFKSAYDMDKQLAYVGGKNKNLFFLNAMCILNE